jgi:hypothetical protein
MRLSAFIPVLLALLASGCVSTGLRVNNQTGTGVFVYSGHTRQVTKIPVDAAAAVPHSSGRIIVVTQRDEVWEYDNIESLVDEAEHDFLRVTLHVNLEPDGGIQLPSGKTLTPARTLAAPR